MKLSYWQSEAGPCSAPQRLDPPRDADVVIVGGGLAGLTTAIRLKERAPHLAVAVLEAQFVGYGASGRNGGLLSPLAAPLLIPGAEASEEQVWALRRLEREIQKASDWVASVLPDAESRRVKLRLEAKGRLSDSGAERVARILERADIGFRLVASNGAKRPRTLELSANTVHPFRLVRSLASHAEGLGVSIHENALVEGIEEIEGVARIALASGRTVRAGTVVIAANAYAWSIRMPPKVPGKPVYNFMVAAEPGKRTELDDISPDGTFNVELNPTYAFYRAHGERLIYGGIEQFSQQTGDDMDVPGKVLARLEGLMAASFPGRRVRVAQAWGGKFHVTSTDMPVIRRAAGARAIVFNLGYGGTGVAMTLVCARLAAGVVCDGRQLDSDDQRLLGVLQSARFPVWGGLRFAAGVALRALTGPVGGGEGGARSST